MHLLKTITELSHEFGTSEYVLGGGGNTSVKDAETLWVKPSGVTLIDLRPEDFVALDRAQVRRLFEAAAVEDAVKREVVAKETLLAARRPEGSSGRPSVEAPLHHIFPQRFVVHTHPALVNGLTCAQRGAEACARLFPDILWMPYCDPGYTLSREAERAIDEYTRRHGCPPSVLMIQNHGIFVAGDSPDDIRTDYRRLMETLRGEYRAAGLECDLPTTPPPNGETDRRMRGILREVLSKDVLQVQSCGPFSPPRGPLSPDHIVYARSFVHVGPVTAASVSDFRHRHGYAPRVFFTDDGVWSVGDNENEARLALMFARDGARVQYLTAAFGGPQYLSDRARAFIENWEVEHYRRRVALEGGRSTP